MLKKLFSLSNGALFVALSLSTIAAWYSIIGLTAIFAGAVLPIIIMGTALEFAKITTTVWLRKYWYRCSLIMKVYLVPAVVLLALLTSMGIFGFLSKAHLDQNIGSGDVQAQVSLLDEKIATQRETIKSSKAMLAQMDQQVNDIMTKGDSEKSVERSVVIRKQQAKERASLQKDIEVANKEIQRLNEERAPIASEMRKVEAEVGPIKYIAALIYGDNPDANVLERAVRWVIILLVVVFDPLAIMLVLAANQSKEWDENDDVENENKLREQVEHEKVVETILEEAPVVEEPIVEEPVVLDVTEEEEEAFKELEPKPEPEKTMAELHPYLNQPFTHFTNTYPLVHKPEVVEPAYEQDDGPLTQEQVEQLKQSVELFGLPEGETIVKEELFPEEPQILTLGIDDVERPGDYVTEPVVEEAHPTEALPYRIDEEYAMVNGKPMHLHALRNGDPDLFRLLTDGHHDINTGFGTSFPSESKMGDVFVRVDTIPNKTFKYNGNRWIEAPQTSAHLSNTEYLQYLIQKLGTGEYDPELLSPDQEEAIKQQIKSGK